MDRAATNFPAPSADFVDAANELPNAEKALLLSSAALLAACSSSDDQSELPAAFSQPATATSNTSLLAPRRRALTAVSSAAATLPTPTAIEVMDWAEVAYSSYFPGHPDNLVSGPYTYRYYAATSHYLAVADGKVYVLGTLSGGTLQSVGSLADFAPRVFGEPRAVSTADKQAARSLLQAQLSATANEIDAVKSQGFAAWLAAQMEAPRSRTGVAWLNANGCDSTSTQKQFITNDTACNWMVWNQLWTAPDAVRMRAALALSEFFVISSDGFSMVWKCYGVAAFWDILVANAFGNFRQLLEQVSLSPAMGSFLSVIGSQKEDASGRQPDENYARELMQLFTIGLYELNPDGTEKLDADGQRIETVSNTEVTNLARVFTGYDYAMDPGPPLTTDDRVHKTVPQPAYATYPMRLLVDKHSTAEVKFLGTTIPANTPATQALNQALDTLFLHPNVGPFFCRQMIQRLVTSNPSPDYVRRVATLFNDNGRGVRGDLKTVFSAIWLDAEALGPGSTEASRIGKLHEPMLRLVQWGRSFAELPIREQWKSFINSYGDQLPLRSQSVFNFFRPGYVPPSTAMAAQAWVAPEFQIVNETTVATYLNYLEQLLRNGFEVMQSDDIFSKTGEFIGAPMVRVPAGYANELPLAGNSAVLVQHLNRVLCAGRLPNEVQQIIIDALNATPLPSGDALTNGQLNRVAAAVLMVMASPEYLVQG